MSKDESKEPLEKEEYLRTQMAILTIGRTAKSLKLDRFLNQITNAESVSPMVDPVIYKKAMDNMKTIKKLALALIPVREAFDETFAMIQKAKATLQAGSDEPPKKGA